MMYPRCDAPTLLVVVFEIIVMMFLLSHPTSVASQEVNLTIIPERTDRPREGDSVILDCRVTSPTQPDAIFWKKKDSKSGISTIFVNETGLNSNADDRFTLDIITKVVSETSPVFSQRVTIQALHKSDEALYSCEAVTGKSAPQILTVYPGEEFPVCSPYGQDAVVVGSTLSCRTVKDSKVPSVTLPGMPLGASGWFASNDGTELSHTVNASDNGTTFTCFALDRNSESQMAFSCKIGPLTVITNDVSGGLSPSDIAGIVIGSILILVIIALHFLCCRCTPQRWIRAKSYLLDIGSSSFGTSNRRDDSAPDSPNSVDLGSSQLASDEVPPSYESVAGNKQVRTVGDTLVVDERDPPATCTSELHKLAPDQPEQGVNIHLDANVISPSVSNPGDKIYPIYDNAKVSPVKPNNGRDTDAGPKLKKIKRFAINRKGKMDKPLASDRPASDTTDASELKKDPSVIYAKVNKAARCSPHSVTTCEDSGAGKISKKIKRFALNRKGKVEKATSPPKPDAVIVYAELDLPENQNGVKSPKEPWTEYAEIKR